MLKYVAVLVFVANPVHQTGAPQNAVLLDEPQVQRKLAIPPGALNDDLSTDPKQQMHQAMIARGMAERQAQLRSDTEKLVALTAELKQHVDKAGVNILSMDVIRKAQEIQKLAKSVQDKMRNAY